MFIRHRLVCGALPCVLACLGPRVHAQGAGAGHAHTASATATQDSLSAMVVLNGSRVAPGLFGRTRTELAVAQPMAMARGSRRDGAVQYALMLNAEHWTMAGGESTPGIWGEGFIDRRHPHTVVHEAMVTLVRHRPRLGASLAVGKGIVPFGTDDPMVRPFVKYAANHHLAQIMERVQVVGALRWRTHLAVEGALFNGDEPASPTAMPQWRRVGDSRALRFTAWPLGGQLEAQASAAAVRSPESPAPVGFDQRKQSASLRATPRGPRQVYVLLEWARTEERLRGRSLFDYQSLLLEGSVRLRGVRVGGRVEETTRPEEERVAPFRTPRPHLDNIVKGLTRWRLVSAQAQVPLHRLPLVHGSLVLEATHARSAPRIVPTIVDPRDIIGADRAWHLTVALRLGAGAMPARVGRHGVASSPPGTSPSLGMAHAH